MNTAQGEQKTHAYDRVSFGLAFITRERRRTTTDPGQKSDLPYAAGRPQSSQQDKTAVLHPPERSAHTIQNFVFSTSLCRPKPCQLRLPQKQTEAAGDLPYKEACTGQRVARGWPVDTLGATSGARAWPLTSRSAMSGPSAVEECALCHLSPSTHSNMHGTRQRRRPVRLQTGGDPAGRILEQLLRDFAGGSTHRNPKNKAQTFNGGPRGCKQAENQREGSWGSFRHTWASCCYQ